VTSAGFKEQSLDIRARVSAVLLELCVRYADSFIDRSTNDDAGRFVASNVFEISPIQTAPNPRATPSSRYLAFTHAAGSTTTSPTVPTGRDTPTTMLSALAELLKAHAGTHVDVVFTDDIPRAAHDAFVSFVNFACKAAPLLDERIETRDLRRKGWGSTARAAYIRVLQAYACSAEPAFQIVSQLFLQAQHDDYEHLSWHEFFKLLVGLYNKYLTVSAESRFSSPDGGLICFHCFHLHLFLSPQTSGPMMHVSPQSRMSSLHA
jgi:hypothetical protein